MRLKILHYRISFCQKLTDLSGIPRKQKSVASDKVMCAGLLSAVTLFLFTERKMSSQQPTILYTPGPT